MNTIVEHFTVTKIYDSAGPDPAPVTACSGIAPKRRRAAGIAMTGISLMATIAAAGAPGPAATASALRSAAHRATAGCSSEIACYTPQGFEVAYGVQPLLQRGIDGRGETVVLPELAQSQLTQLNSALQADADHHVTVVAATGDTGAAGEPCALITGLLGNISSNFTPRKEVGLVASYPLVLSVGGTTLDASHTTGAWIGETTWGLPYGDPGTGFQASGGGFSHLFRRPSY
jgi:subtilase family serine protease